MRKLAPLLVQLLVAGAPGYAHAGGGALDRFERAHRPADDHRSSSSGSSSSSSSSSDNDDDDDTYGSSDDGWDDDTSSSGSSDDATWALLVFCAIPPFTFACFQPSHRLAREVYGSDRLYIEPLGERSSDGLFTERVYREEDKKRIRWGELSLLGYRAFNEPVVYSHDFDATLWAAMVLINLSWEHFYEQIPDTGEWDHLDLFGGHVGANVTGPFVDFMELYLFAGATVMHGQGWTPAFDVGLEGRFYPVQPLALHASANVSVFELGPPLLDARLDAGVALGPLEIRLGPRWLYQGDAQGFWGPAATLAGRF